MFEVVVNLIFQIGIPVLLLILGFSIGSFRERGHYRSIIAREDQYRDLPIFSARHAPKLEPAPGAELVQGNVVISIDYFKRFLAGLRMVFGGRIRAYESLVDRARREALLRMRQAAREMGAAYVFNVRMETASISKGGNNAIGSVEVVAYGTAIIPAVSPVVAPVAGAR